MAARDPGRRLWPVYHDRDHFDSSAPAPSVLVGSAPPPSPGAGGSCLVIEPSRREYMRDFGASGEKAWHFSNHGLGRAFLAPITEEEIGRDPLVVLDVAHSVRKNPTLYLLVPPLGGRQRASLDGDACLLCKQTDEGSRGTELTVPPHFPTAGEKALDYLLFIAELPGLLFLDALTPCAGCR